MARLELTLAALLSLSQCGLAQTSPKQAAGTPAAQEKDDLTNLDLGSLANMQVTTASKKAESLMGVAAAMYVITAEDIKRLGAVNVPEALRIVPGIQVAQIDATHYAVSARGFNSQYADKLLVLIDGRSIYNNLYGGVYWEDQNISMDEIDRIEVIRGPGGTIWGANAVNGVINIITKNAKDTKGFYADAGGATHGQIANGTLRYGSSLSHGDFRVTAFGLKDEQSLNTSGVEQSNEMGGERLSARYDGGSESTGKVLFEGDWHRFDARLTGSDTITTAPFSVATEGVDPSMGGSLLARVEKAQTDGSNDSLQATYDMENKWWTNSWLLRDNTFDLEYQHGFKQLGKNSLIGGLGYRTTTDDDNSPSQFMLNPAATFSIFSGFLQDEIEFDKMKKLTLGAKLEHNDFSGWEVEPSARFSVQPNDKSAYWVALSRAVRTPNRATTDMALSEGMMDNGGNPYTIMVNGVNDKSTDVIAAEAGYRTTVGEKLSLDVSLYNNSYTDINGEIQGAPTVGMLPYPHGVIPINLTDVGNGTTRGLEFSSKYQATKAWRLDFGYAYTVGYIPSTDPFATPKNEIKALSTYTFSPKLSFDQGIFYAGGFTDGNPSYTMFDLQLRYKPTDKFTLSVGGRNLGEGRYTQIGSSGFTTGGLVQPSLYANAAWKF